MLLPNLVILHICLSNQNKNIIKPSVLKSNKSFKNVISVNLLWIFSEEADCSDEEYDGDILGLSTMYKIGSKPDLVLKNESGQSDYKVVDDYSGVSGQEKPNLVFSKSESLADEEGKTTFVIIFRDFAKPLWKFREISRNMRQNHGGSTFLQEIPWN